MAAVSRSGCPGATRRAALILGATVACARLDPLSSDALCARSHLTAIETGADCGCSEKTMEVAVTQAIRKYVMDRAPKGLLDDVQVKFGPDGLELFPKTARKPTPEEKEQIDRLVRHALAHFRDQVKRGFGPDAYKSSPKP